MKDVITYIKETKEALKNYTSQNENIDNELCQRIYDYAMRFESLTKEERAELDAFISANVFDEIHVANLYINPEREEILNRQFLRMTPIKLAKPDGRIYKIEGDILRLRDAREKQEMHVKVYRKTYARAA